MKVLIMALLVLCLALSQAEARTLTIWITPACQQHKPRTLEVTFQKEFDVPTQPAVTHKYENSDEIHLAIPSDAKMVKIDFRAENAAKWRLTATDWRADLIFMSLSDGDNRYGLDCQ